MAKDRPRVTLGFVPEAPIDRDRVADIEPALEQLHTAAIEIARQTSFTGVFEALLSLYLDMSIRAKGPAETIKTLQRATKAVPRMASAIRAAETDPEGEA